MDVNASLLSLWEHACCGDRYWSAARLCDRCGKDAFGFVTRMSVADAMARRHFHDRPPTVPTPVPVATTSRVQGPPSPAVALAPAQTSRVAGPVPARLRPAIREEGEGGPPAARAATVEPYTPGAGFLIGTCVAGALVFLVTCMLMLI